MGGLTLRFLAVLQSYFDFRLHLLFLFSWLSKFLSTMAVADHHTAPRDLIILHAHIELLGYF